MSEGFVVRRGGGSTDVSAGAGSGGTEVTSGGKKYHTFTSSGTFTVSTAGLFEVLAVGGGGSAGSNGASNGGGGAGGLVQKTIYLASGAHTVTIGAGGAGVATRVPGNCGNSSTIGSIDAIGGGGGVPFTNAAIMHIGLSGGCGGGGWNYVWGRLSTGLQGFDSEGFGGAGQGGDVGNNVSNGGDGTSSYDTWLSATSQGVDVSGTRYIAAGGAGNNTAGGTGGDGGGGDYGNTTAGGDDGVSNTGSGGGASSNYSAGSGGSGLIIIRYAV